MRVIDEIAAERARQIAKEGYDAKHDDEHTQGEIAMAAACYAAPLLIYRRYENSEGFSFYNPWPWHYSFDKRPATNVGKETKARRRRLVQAAALLVAEIERLDRRDCDDHDRTKGGLCPPSAADQEAPLPLDGLHQAGSSGDVGLQDALVHAAGRAA